MKLKAFLEPIYKSYILVGKFSISNAANIIWIWWAIFGMLHRVVGEGWC